MYQALVDCLFHKLGNISYYFNQAKALINNALVLGRFVQPVLLEEYKSSPSRVISYAPNIPLVTTHNPNVCINELPNYKWWFPSFDGFIPRLIMLTANTCSNILGYVLKQLDFGIEKNTNRKTSRTGWWVKCYVNCWLYYFKIVLFVVLLSFIVLSNIFVAMINKVELFYETYDHQQFNGVRAAFRRTPFKITKTDYGINHSHNYQAGIRSGADELINEFIISQKLRPYSIQKSSRDVRMNIQGSIDLRMPMDAHSRDAATDKIPKNVCFKLINVDYYVDWLDYLWMDRPFVMFTATPSTLVGCDENVKWTFSNNHMMMSVDGGAVYTHQLWDYNTDILTALYPGFGITYYVDTVRVDKHWSIVLMIPQHRFKSSVIIPTLSIKRRQLSHQVKTFHKPDSVTESLVMNSYATKGEMQIAMPGEFEVVVLSPEIISYLRSCALSRKMEAQSIFTAITNVYGTGARTASQIIYTHFPLIGDNLPLDVPPLRLTEKDVNYFCATDIRDGPDPKQKNVAKVVGPVIMEGGLAAGESRANDSAAVATRVQVTSSRETKIPPDWMSYFKEFCSLSVPEKLAPFTPEQIRDSLKRATQVENFDKAVHNVPDFFTAMQLEFATFQKKEAYAKLTDPRNITTVAVEHFIAFSKYTQPISKYLALNANWYIFGKHPDKVAERVHEMVAHSTSIAETDFSRFDGTHTHAMYELEENYMKHCYTVEHHEEISKAYVLIRAVRARTRNGIHYDPVGTRGSGGADTSIGNSFINAFFNYVVLRKSGSNEPDAYKQLGVYGGDDGCTANPSSTMNTEASRANLRLKITTRVPGEIVTVLARVYINPWMSPKHMCDPKRIISRLHISVKGDQSDNIQEMVDRASGYLITDPHTAVVCNWAHAVKRCYPDNPGEGKRTESYSVRCHEGKNGYSVTFDESIGIVASSLGIAVDEVRKYCTLLDDCKTPKDFENVRPIITHDPQSSIMIVPGVNVGSILHPVDEKNRATKSKPLEVEKFEIPKDFESCTTTSADQAIMVKTFKHIHHTCKSIRRVIDATAGCGFDTHAMRKVFKCDVLALENNIERFGACKRNLANQKISVLHTDSAKFEYKSGDLVMLDPLWDMDRTRLRYDGKPIGETITSLVAKGVFVLLRAPLQFKYGDEERCKPFVIRRDKKPVYKLYTFKAP